MGLYAVQGGGGLYDEENNDDFSATNVVAKRPPEHQPTGTPTARAKIERVPLIFVSQVGQNLKFHKFSNLKVSLSF